MRPNSIDNDEYFAIGNDELGGTVKKGDKVTNGTYTGIVEYGIDTISGKETNLMGFITTEDDKHYLVSLKDRLIKDWRLCSPQEK